jgi:hypothetical protein
MASGTGHTVTEQHNHAPQPFGAFRPPGQCPRCDQRRAERAAEGIADHNHAPLPFGQRRPRGECPRCDELHSGAKPRTSHRQRNEDIDRLAREAHFAPGGPHARGTCGPVCTFGDW